jgi:excisionase family DNA binding protein
MAEKILTNGGGRLAYGVQELAGALGVTAGFIRLEIQRGRLGIIRVGRRVLISRAEAERYLATRSTTAQEAR